MHPIQKDQLPEEFRSIAGDIKEMRFPRQGYTSDLAIIKGSNGLFAIKRAKGERFCHCLHQEAQVLRCLLETGLPIPRVHGLVEQRESGQAWAMFQYIHGQTLRSALSEVRSKDTKYELIYSFGKVLAWIHGTACPQELMRTDMPWVDFMLLEAENNLQLFQTEGSAETLSTLKRTKPTYTEQTLIHGDFTVDNVMVHNGKITGIIDWGDGCYGDPRYDVTLAIRPKVGTFHTDEEIDVFFEGYGKREVGAKESAFFGDKGLYAFF